MPHRRMVTAALLVAMTVTALEQLVVSPAMPTIISQLKGFEIYPWVVSAYLLAATVSTPIYGKLADLFGRKRVLLFGLALFSAGSMLSGAAQSMGQLIAMRSIQGLGAGAVGPIVLTLLGDLFTLKERARIQGLFAAVWGLSSVAGPMIGGWLTVELGWRWVFFVSVPFAVIAFVMLVLAVHERVEPRRVAPIDWAGAGLLTAGLSGLLLIVLDGSALGLANCLILGAATLALMTGFVAWERRAADPILPIDLMTRRVIATSVAGSFLIGGILFGIETYVPLYVQGVLGGTAKEAGRALMPLFLAWAVSVTVAARAVVRWGFRGAGMVGSCFIAAGMLTLAVGAAYPSSARLTFAGALVVIGIGMGPTSLSFILAVQHAVSWGQRGVATGAVQFFRTIGGALGVGALGGALAWELSRLLKIAGAAGVDVGSALRTETHHLLPTGALALVQTSLAHSLRDVYLMMVFLSVGCLVCAVWLPGQGEPASSETDQAAEAQPVDIENLAIAGGEA
ncbi:MAG: MFS transporter [Paludisphaera borealis]|uniref:MFS transporter n=1 Tax=Paludisphaera borealis TaxID=1387353 RepID=UPI002846FB7B|nr:MFS transporter [Paludisphaera borealis]MDR3618792.1 MFS transporter [Paludisphaera borealis]